MITKKNKKDTHGSASVWTEVFEGNDVIYSDHPQTQNQLFEHTKISFLQEIFPKGNKKMLEVGCGSAFVSLFFAKQGYAVTCLDINKNILDVARKNFKKEGVKGTFVVRSAEHLPFEDKEFDVVSSFGLMEHFEDPSIAFREMVRILKPGGLFFADIVPNRFSVQTFGNIFNVLVTFIFWTLKGNPRLGWEKGMRNLRPLYFESSLSWQEYRRMIKESGVKYIEVRGNRPWPRLTLPGFLDRIYTHIISLSLPLWKSFDRWDHWLPRFWGAGLWFWGKRA